MGYSTSNLLRHVRNCEPEETPEVELLASFAAGSTYSKAKFRFKLAVWIARRHRPFNLVEDPEFRELLYMLYGRVEIPSRKSTARDVLSLVRYVKQQLIARLQVNKYSYGIL